MAGATDRDGLPTVSVGSPSPGADERDVSVRAEIAALSMLALDALRLRWRNETGRVAPAHLPKFLLLRMLAYGQQTQAIDLLAHPARPSERRLAKQLG